MFFNIDQRDFYVDGTCFQTIFPFLMTMLWHSCFPVNFAKFLRTSSSQNSSGRLLLYLKRSTVTCTSLNTFHLQTTFLINICLAYLKTNTCLRSTMKPLQKQPPDVFYKKGVFKNFTKFTGKYLYQSFFLLKLQAKGLKLY